MPDRHDWKPALAPHLRGLHLDPAREAEIIEELSSHLDDRAAELVTAGRPLHEARAMAVGDLVEDPKLAARLRSLRQAHIAPTPPPGAPRGRLLADIWQDIRYAVRMLRKQPGFAIAAILTLALGIGANSAIFSLVNAALFERLPVADTASLYYVHNGQSGSAVFAYPEVADMRDHNDVFIGLATWGPITASLNADNRTDLVGGLIVSGAFFDLLGVRAAHGRALAPADDVTPGAHPVAVISDGLWQRRFGGRSDLINSQVLLNGQRFTIVGILPPAFRGPQVGVTRDLYVPMMMQATIRPPRGGYAGEMNPDLLGVRTNRWLYIVGRARPSVAETQIEAALTATMTSLDRARDASSREHPITATPVDEGMPGQRARIVPVARLLMGTVGIVLLIACANVANLLLSRAASRRREIAVRLAIGANRWRLVRQFLTESVLLALSGGLAGVGLAWLIARGFQAAPPPAGALPIALEFALDMRVLLFTLALSFLTGLLFGLAPALRASRPTLVPALRDDAFVPDERARRFNVRKVLVVAEVALSLALLISAGLFVRSLAATRAIEPGFEVDHLINAPLNVNLLRYTTAQGREFYQRVTERVGAIPGVRSAAVARIQPLGPTRTGSVMIEGRVPSGNVFAGTGAGPVTSDNRSAVNSNVIGPRYFETMGMTLVRGREFDSTDGPDAPRVVIVNQAFVALHFLDEEPLGRRLSFRDAKGPWHTIVGVVSNSKYASLSEPFLPIAYLPLSQNHETGVVLQVRTAGDPAALVGAVRQEIQAVEPNLPMPAVEPMATTIGTSLYATRMGAWLIGVFGGLALLLASIGVYGVLSFSIARRTRELAIRQALGAERRDILGLVLKEGMGLVGIGLAIGLTGAFLGAKSLAQFLYSVSARDTATMVLAPAVLVLVALIACLVPARRAMKVQPTMALKS
jgi:predicted permease